MAISDAFDEMFEPAHPTAGDDRYCDSIRDRPRQVDVKSELGAVSVHRCQQYFPGSERSHFTSELKGSNAGRPAAPMGKNFPAAGRGSFGVNSNDNALAAEASRRAADKGRVANRCGVDRYLVGTGKQKSADIVQGSYAAAYGQGHKALLRGCTHDIEQNTAVLVAGTDVEKTEFIGTGMVVSGSNLNRIASIAQVSEFRALDDAAILHVQTWDNSCLEHSSGLR